MRTLISHIVKWTSDNKSTIVRNSFLIPILLVVLMSISHVVSWYDIGNPISWAIYLSIAIEIFALASISAASIRASKTAIWILFGIVTSIQMIGNIYYEFNEIQIDASEFKSWVNLIQPFFIDWNALDHKRFLAIIQGGTLPVLSLTALHFYIQFKEKQPAAIVEDSITDPYSIDESEAIAEEIVKTFEDGKSNTAEETYQDSPINDKSKLTESGSGLPQGNVRSDKGNNATIAEARREINPKTGKF